MILTLALTVFNRYEMLLESFANVIDDPRIDEILIMDDASAPEYWNKIKELPKFNPKIKVVRQLENRGMLENKMSAVINSKNDWVLLGDSDNVFDKTYIDALETTAIKRVGILDASNIYCPSFAKPNFDYRKYEAKTIDKNNAPHLIRVGGSAISCFLNTCNYVVNKEKYIEVWKENKSMIASDTIWFNYLWLEAGNSFFVVPDMHYLHRVHNGSGFAIDMDYNLEKAEEVKKLILEL